MNDTYFIPGKAVNDFEARFAKAHNVKHAVCFSSGITGNYSALRALSVGRGDEVIIPANSHAATAWGVGLCGAKPVLVDCDENSYTIDPAKIEQAITSKTKTIVAVLFGQPADMDPIKEIADKYNLNLIEDCTQAHIAEYKGEKVGGLSIASSFSFYPEMNLGTYGECGAVLTNDDTVALKVRLIYDHGREQNYCQDIIGNNHKMEALQGAVLGIKLRSLDYWTNARRRIALLYNQLLLGMEQVILPVEMSYAMHVYHLYVIRIKNGRSKCYESARNKLANYLKANGIPTEFQNHEPLHLQKCFSFLGNREGDFPVSEKLAQEAISLPMYPELTEDQVEIIAKNVSYFVKNMM